LKGTALITGATGGLGIEFARIHAAKGGDLVLVARSRDKLESMKAELETIHGISVAIFAQDLSVAGSAQKVFLQTQSAGIEISVLINNAGFGGHGNFHEQDLAWNEAMMQLNMNTLVSLTHLYLTPMVQRGRGEILNVASTAAFMPGPLQAVYYATKAFVLSFSQAIAEELSGTGVMVTTLCPGPVNTGFVEAGGLEGVRAFRNAASAESVANCGYNAMEKGKLVTINNGLLGFVLNWVLPLFPRKTLLKISRKAMEKSG
jgi:hypothetical protein